MYAVRILLLGGGLMAASAGLTCYTRSDSELYISTWHLVGGLVVRHLLKEGCQGGEKIIPVVVAGKPDLVGSQRGGEVGEGKMVVPLARLLGRVGELVLVEVAHPGGVNSGS